MALLPLMPLLLARVSLILERAPNFHVDIAARIGGRRRTPAQTG